MKNINCSLITLTLILSTLAGCTSTTKLGTQSGDRKQFMLVTQEYMQYQDNKSSAKMFGGSVKKESYRANEERLVKIMNTLIPYTKHYISEDREINWSISLVASNKLNAGAMDNGTVIVTNELYNIGLTDEDLAVIISHEMAHSLRQHNREIKSWKHVVQPALLATAFLTSGATAYAAGISHDVSGSQYSQFIEEEADLIGLDLMARAGYSPANAIATFTKIEPVFKQKHPFLSRMPSFLSSHPSFKNRIEAIKQHIDELNKTYQAYDPKAVVDTSNNIKYEFGKTYEVEALVYKIENGEKILVSGKVGNEQPKTHITLDGQDSNFIVDTSNNSKHELDKTYKNENGEIIFVRDKINTGQYPINTSTKHQ